VRVASSRGHLKVFLGMAAGVGKTYRMLQEGYAELQSGGDMLIGFLETHKRADIERLARGMPILPRRMVSYRSMELEEMDLPGILERALVHVRKGEHDTAETWMREVLRRAQALPADGVVTGLEPLPATFYRDTASAYLARSGRRPGAP